MLTHSVLALGLPGGLATYFVNDEIITPQLNIPYEPSKLKLTETSFTCQFMDWCCLVTSVQNKTIIEGFVHRVVTHAEQLQRERERSGGAGGQCTAHDIHRSCMRRRWQSGEHQALCVANLERTSLLRNHQGNLFLKTENLVLELQLDYE